MLQSFGCSIGKTCRSLSSTASKTFTQVPSPKDIEHGEQSESYETKKSPQPSNDDSDRAEQTSSAPHRHQRIWHASDDRLRTEYDDNHRYSYWTDRVADRLHSSTGLEELLQSIEDQEVSGGRLRQRHLGVLHQDPATDMELLIDNYTVRAVASALRDREDALQYAAVLADKEDWEGLSEHLRVFHPRFVLERRYSRSYGSAESKEGDVGDNTPSSSSGGASYRIDVTQTLDRGNIEFIRKTLMRMPRTVTQAHSKRAAVVIALCTVDNVPCVLLEKRAHHLRAHPDEVCLPGGMVCDVQDRDIVSTCLREMKEEIGGLGDDDDHDKFDVLGVFRCNWGEIHHLVNVAVTPVVCFLGELPEELLPNKDEVSHVFTVTLASLIDKSLWEHREGLAPIFVGGPDVIWGLSGYILERFAKDVLMPNSRPATTPSISDLS